MKGGTIEFTMSNLPNTSWGANDADIPSTAITEFPLLISPFTTQIQKTFYDNITVDLKTNSTGVEIYYTTDGSQPDKSKKKISHPPHPWCFNRPLISKPLLFCTTDQYSYVMEADYHKIIPRS